LPFPLLKGDKLRPFYFIKHLCLRGHKISLLSFIEEEKERTYKETLLEYCEDVEMVLLPKWRSYLNMLSGIFSNTPFQICYYFSIEMREKILHMTRNGKYDVVHFVLSRMIPYAGLANGIPRVIDHIDALSLNMERRFDRERGIRRLLFFREWKSIRKYEDDCSGLFNYSIVTSEGDRQYLCNKRTEVIPNGIDLEQFSPQKKEKDIDLIFTGNMGYFPNEDAVMYFSEKIFPLILRHRPSIQFFIVGVNPTKRIKKLSDGRNIFVTGHVDKIQDYLHRARIAVCPMKSGSGIQNKILEAMACGVPVIATSFAAGGIAVEHGKDIILSEEPGEFAEDVLRLLEDRELRESIAANARQLVEQNHSWEGSVSKLEKVYKLAQQKIEV